MLVLVDGLAPEGVLPRCDSKHEKGDERLTTQGSAYTCPVTKPGHRTWTKQSQHSK